MCAMQIVGAMRVFLCLAYTQIRIDKECMMEESVQTETRRINFHQKSGLDNI